MKRFPKWMRWTGKKLRRLHRLITGEANGREALDRGATVVAGGLLVGLGILLIPLPGPGWFTLLVGLSLLGYEFRWAQRLLKTIRGSLTDLPGTGVVKNVRSKLRSYFGREDSTRDRS